MTSRVQSLRCAAHGLIVLVREEVNARIHLLAAAAVVALGLWLDIERSEWIAVTLAISLVIACEALNTAIESVTDLASPELHPLAGRAKDLAAGGVLVGAVGAAVIGVLVFLPRLQERFH